ncbi:protoporphyrinogen oxidase-like protein [Candidatus Dojkabacteria bacterium]|nr:protoporphyrinogen oxidase-like protein [Candidatus Dojkabacteria bacterium]
MKDCFVLGAGVTGLSAAIVSGLPVIEAEKFPGGKCASYYMRAGSTERLFTSPKDQEVYRFELGGGHWIHSLDVYLDNFLKAFARFKGYSRDTAVYLEDKRLLIPYPIQNNLRYLGPKISESCLNEIIQAQGNTDKPKSWKEWFKKTFGATLCRLFFYPFHELYTVGLYSSVLPSDLYKNPIDIKSVVAGAITSTSGVGYNSKFVYPVGGLDRMVRNMAAKCEISYGKSISGIDIKSKFIHFENGDKQKYDKLLSTISLAEIIKLTGLDKVVVAKPDPSTTVLVTNIGAIKGEQCPQSHWLYIPKSKSGFYRVGFYSNVDEEFIPKSSRKTQDRASIYVEKAYLSKEKLTRAQIRKVSSDVVNELQDLEWIKRAEVVDSCVVKNAYVWEYPRSSWVSEATSLLRKNDIFQVGRFATWNNDGLVRSIKDGLVAGASFKIINETL